MLGMNYAEFRYVVGGPRRHSQACNGVALRPDSPDPRTIRPLDPRANVATANCSESTCGRLLLGKLRAVSTPERVDRRPGCCEKVARQRLRSCALLGGVKPSPPLNRRGNPPTSMFGWPTQSQILISSKTRRNGGPGARHMVRYVSRKGSQAVGSRLGNCDRYGPRYSTRPVR